jgi:hypothetical protein
VLDFIGEVVGVVLGTIVDLGVDIVTMPFDAVAAVAQGKNFFEAMASEFGELASNGKVSESVRDFTKGAVKFTGALVECEVRTGVALAEAAATGKSCSATLEENFKRLGDSFDANIVSNPAFLEVAGWIAMAASTAVAVASGGTLAGLAVATMVFCELDKRYGMTEKLVGKEAAPWVKLGLNVAVIASTLFLNPAGDAAKLKGCVSILQGGTALAQGVRTIVEGNRQADELDRSADMQSTLNRMQQLQRMLDDLLSDLEEESDRSNQNMNAGAEASQTQAATYQAAVMKA